MNETNAFHALLITDARGTRKLPLDGLKYTIGRDVNNDIQLHSRFVSRQHAVLLRVPDAEPGKYLYRVIDGDLTGKPSVNGVIINSHQRITSYNLCHGDIITLAPNAQLTYLTDDSDIAALPQEILKSSAQRAPVEKSVPTSTTDHGQDYGQNYSQNFGQSDFFCLAIEDATGGFS